jgi:hypothetical protein
MLGQVSPAWRARLPRAGWTTSSEWARLLPGATRSAAILPDSVQLASSRGLRPHATGASRSAPKRTASRCDCPYRTAWRRRSTPSRFHAARFRVACTISGTESARCARSRTTANRMLDAVFRKSGVRDAHSHRFRHYAGFRTIPGGASSDRRCAHRCWTWRISLASTPGIVLVTDC